MRYRTHPVHHFPWLGAQGGFESLATETWRLARLDGSDLIVIDGFVGLEWDRFIDRLRVAFAQHGITPTWLSTEPCFLPPGRVEALLTSTLTDDPVFGRVFRGHLEELWDASRVANVREQVEQRGGLTVLYGYGASVLVSGGVCVYVDVPKDRGQERAARATVTNVGATEPAAPGQMYKRLYFVDWPMLNRVKRALWSRLDVFVDGTDADLPVFVAGDSFRRALHEMALRPFRVKPWFAPGPWGGQWMKDRFGLPPDEPNYAWSFELIAPECGVLLGDDRCVLECSFDWLLWSETDAVLGRAVSARYGSTFPIRFDYLDTMGGSNLSCQVHPRLDYIRDEFGEPFTQDETYYIVTRKPGARIFLGLHDDADVESFRADAIAARDRGIRFDITDHVNSYPSKPHDLFLIPSGAVHCSGADNLVLEISATPYIYTFKLYDYLRHDLRGELRPVHVERAFANLDARWRAHSVRSVLRPAPTIVRRGPTWSEYSVGDVEELFFAIHRLDFEDGIEDHTGGKFVVLNLVAGERCQILSASNAPVEVRFAETVVVPASIDQYCLRNTGALPCKVIKAYVKG